MNTIENFNFINNNYINKNNDCIYKNTIFTHPLLKNLSNGKDYNINIDDILNTKYETFDFIHI